LALDELKSASRLIADRDLVSCETKGARQGSKRIRFVVDYEQVSLSHAYAVPKAASEDCCARLC